jgi:SulP family sulfate permease
MQPLMKPQKKNTGQTPGALKDRLNAIKLLNIDLKRLPSEITLGILIGITEAFVAISLINLIFTGPLSSLLPLGISIALLATTIVLITTTLLSTLPYAIGILQDGPAIIMAVLVSGYFSLPISLDAETLTATVLTSMVFGSLFVGVTFFAMGVLRWGNFVRYIPYPVIGGFLAGTGWLITLGGLGIVLGELPSTIPDFQKLFDPTELILWVPAVLSGLTIFTVMRRSKSPLSFPLTLVFLIAVFYLGLLITGTSLDEAMSIGLLLGNVGEPAFQPISFSILRQADWLTISTQAGNFGILVGISLISLLLYLTSLEVTAEREIDVNRELRNAGIVNVITGLAGGMVGFLSLSLSSLTYRNGSYSRVVGLSAAAMVSSILVIGFSSLAYFPLAIVAGMLLFIGIDFLYNWVIATWKRFSALEYSVIIIILIIIALTDFLIGVLVGLAIMIMMFVVSYSKVQTIQHTFTGNELQSNVDRNSLERRWLYDRGHAIRIILLRGFLFFGTANSITDKLRDFLDVDPDRMPRFIILDFKNVTGLDTSAALSLIKIEHLSAENQIELVLTGLSSSQVLRLERGGMNTRSERVHRLHDLDRGLEWCEQQLLNDEQKPCDPLPEGISAQLTTLGFNERSVNRLMDYLQPVDLSKGEYLIHKDEAADALYYIEAGRVSVVLEQAGGEQIRLRSLTHGATVGEMGLYSGAVRSASVIAEEPTRVHRLSLEAMERMTKSEPDLLAAFHRWVAASLSERLAQKSRGIGVLHSS